MRIRPIDKTRIQIRLTMLAVALTFSWCGVAFSDPAATSQRIALEKPPTAVVASHDGRTLYIGLDRRFGVDGGIAVYRRNDAGFNEIAELPVADGVLGLAVSSDERTVVAATPVGLVAVDERALVRGGAAATALRDGDAPGTNQLVISPDNRYVFFTNSRAADLGVARLTSATTPAEAPTLAFVGHVPLDRVPGGLVLSHDGSMLFVASEVDNVDPADVPGADDFRLSRKRCTSNLGPNGVLSVVSVALAIRAQSAAVLTRTAAGCAPVRVALGPADDLLWVSDSGEDRVLAFDVAQLRRSKRALSASIAVGHDPVGIAVSTDGRAVLVANSNHAPGPERGAPGTLSLIDVEAVRHEKLRVPRVLDAGLQPREVVAINDGSYLVTNYDGRSIDIVTPAGLTAPPLGVPSVLVPPQRLRRVGR